MIEPDAALAVEGDTVLPWVDEAREIDCPWEERRILTFSRREGGGKVLKTKVFEMHYARNSLLIILTFILTS